MSVELGRVRVLGADAVGQPGERRFRLFVQTARGSAIMWMEKEQLNSLSLALDRAMAQLTEGQVLRTEARAGEQPMPGQMPDSFPGTPDYELQVGQMKLSYDGDAASFALSVVWLEIVLDSSEEPLVMMREDDAVSFLFSLEDAQELSTAIIAVINAGRPVCPLCHTPLDGGPHACVQQNGHREILQIETSDDVEEE
jgi:uncharacterized repeat protein (TIGR03847 family)